MKGVKKKEEPRIKQMPGEYEPEYIECSNEGQRDSLAYYYSIGGKSSAFAEFKGQVFQIAKEKGILFKRLYVKFDDCYGLDVHTVEDVEDHVWIRDAEPFFQKDIKLNDCVSFSGIAYAYKRKNGTIDYALKECCDIKIIPDYELPDMTEVSIKEAWHAAKQLACETCLFSEQCYGDPCIAVPGYREEKTKQIFYMGHPDLAEKELSEIREMLTSEVYLGVQLATITGNEAKNAGVNDGLIVIGASATSRLVQGDRIIKVDGNDIVTIDDIANTLSSHHAGDIIRVETDQLKISSHLCGCFPCPDMFYLQNPGSTDQDGVRLIV